MPRPRRHLAAVDGAVDGAVQGAVHGARPEPNPTIELLPVPGPTPPGVRSPVVAGTAAVATVSGEQAAAQRDRFLAAFAHELRAPLTVALGWLRVLDDEPAPEAATGVAGMRGALDQLYGRLLDMELLAAASLGRLALQRETLPVRELAAGLPGLEHADDAADHLVSVDVALGRRVVRELRDAAALPPEPDHVRLETDVVGPWVELRFVREADPIEPAVLRALLQPFEVDAAATGVPFGLCLARALADAHGGSLGVEQDDAHGVLWVRLPRLH